MSVVIGRLLLSEIAVAVVVSCIRVCANAG